MPAAPRPRKRHNPRNRPTSSRYRPDLKSEDQKTSGSDKNAQKPEKKPDGPVVYPMNYAGPLRRLYAFLIDVGMIFLVIYTVAPVSGTAMFNADAAPQDLFFFFGYFVIPTTIWGRTPGKWVAGIVVVGSDGRTPGPAAIPREMIGRFISAIAVGIGLAWIVFDPKRQGWHDKIAGTYVVDNPYSGGPKFMRDFFKLGAKTKDENQEPLSSSDRQRDPESEKQGNN